MMRAIHAFGIGVTVKVGAGAHTWRITGFFGEHADIAALTRVDLPSSNTSANFERLTKVVHP